MDKVKDLKDKIERTFSHLETYWGDEVPDALNRDDWQELELMTWIEEARGIPNVHYENLMKYLDQSEGKAEYQIRLDKLNELIARYKPAFSDFLGI